jgi:RNA polymerase sigma-70 factor (ECF subfamily)
MMFTRSNPKIDWDSRGDHPAPGDPLARLTEGCLRGDSGSFSALVAATEPGMRRLIGRWVGDRAEIDDLVQETYLRAWRSWPRFRGESRFSTWLTRIALNVAQSWRRRRRLISARLDHHEATLVASPSLSEASAATAYERALAGLAPELRQVFLLHEAEGLSYQAIAETLACPIGTVMSRLHRARACMLRELRDWLEDEAL